MQTRSLQQLRRALSAALFVLLLNVAGMAKMYAYDFSAVCETGQTLYYNIIDANNHYVELTCPGEANYSSWNGFDKPTGDIVLPESVQYDGINYNVISIGNYAFYTCSGFTGDLTIPNSVTTIGNSAFSGCSGFTGDLTIPNSVTSIGNSAFSYCSGFTGNLTIPNSVTSIGNYAFSGCISFTGNLTIPNSVTSIGNYAFSGCSSFTGDLTIPNSVTSIGNSAFYNCSGFTGSLTIPSSVMSIGYYAFSGCSGFTGSLTIPNSVTSIGNSAFYNCSGFTGDLTIPNSVTSIDDSAFSGCSSFTGDLTIPNSVTTIGSGAFSGCSGFTGSLTIPNSVTSIGNSAFYYCSGFTGDLTIPNSVTSIGNSAFYYCSGFTGDLTIPNSVTSIGDSAFSGCSGFTEVHYNAICANASSSYSPFQGCGGTLIIGDNVERIPGYMFYNCSGFTGSLTIPSSVTSIGNSAFYNCSGFTGDLTIPNSVTSIGNSAFYNCSGFTGSLTIPSSVMSIGYYAFSGCSGFTGSLTIPNSVTSIGNSAFYNCSGFTGDLTIPNSVTTIGSGAFSGCSGFTGSLTIPNSVTSIGDSAFSGCSGFTEVHYNAINCANASSSYSPFQGCGGTLIIGENVERIPDYMFYNCSGFTGSLTIPSSVTSIGKIAFNNCSGFTEVQYNAINCANASSVYPPFQGCGGTLIIGDNVERIPNYMFCNCSGFTGSLTIPSSVMSIGYYAFSGCSGFTEVDYNAINCANAISAFTPFQGCGGTLIIGDNVERIPDCMFCNCSGFTGDLTIPNSVTTIGSGAFSGCSGFTGSLTIPNSVTSIGNSAFFGCSGFTGDLTVPNSVTTIGNSAFSGCSGFTGNLMIPSSMTSIGGNAFKNCSGFTEVDYNAINCANASSSSPPFQGCGGTLVVGDNVERIPDYMFYNCSGFTGSLTIPSSVMSIGYYAFSGCSGFTEVHYNAINCANASSSYSPFQGCGGTLIIGDNVERIPYYMFYYCSGFTEVQYNAINCANANSSYPPFKGCGGTLVVGDNVERIPDYMFYNCSGFTGSLTIPSSVTSIGNSAFKNCSGFTEVDYNAINCANASSSSPPFQGCGGTLIIGDNVERIPSYMFYNCSGFTGSLTIPSSVTSIGNSAFKNCSGFTEVDYNAINCANASSSSPPFQGCGGTLVIGENVERIPNYMFYDCSGFTGDLTIPNSVTTIGNSAFSGCSGFTGNLMIPSSMTSIGGNAFKNCSGFTGDLTIPNSVTTIGNSAFSGCSGFTGNLMIPSSMTSIGGNAFKNCSGFTEVQYNAINCANASSSYSPFQGCGGTLVVGENVERIPDYMFYNCSGFTGSLTIPSSMTSIGSSAFYGCSGFTAMNSLAITPPSLGYNPFYNVDHNVPVTVPCGTITVYQNTSGWNQFTNYQQDCSATSISDEICFGEDYLQNGFEIIQPEVGENEYSITLPSSQGLDSIVNLTLTVYPTYFFTEDTTLCNTSSFTWHGHTYTESGIYYDSLQTIHGCDSIYQLSLDLFNTPLGEFTYMTPTDNYPFTSLPITFSWDAVSGAEYYDLYVWEENDPMPDAPFVSNLTSINYSTTSLSNYHTYNWYVTARNTCYETSSSVKSFYLDIIPSLNANVTQIDFGEVAMNQSTATTVSVTGIVLDDELNVEITGDDASMFSFAQASGWNNYNGGILIVTFNPTTPQYSYNANLVLNSGTITKSVSLTGAVSNLYTFNTYVAEDVYAMNSQIPIYGSVTDWNNAPVADAEVEISVFVMGMKRTLQAMTNASGQFSAVFEPMPSESGYYTVNSGRAGNHNTAIYDDFNIPGMTLVSSDYILCAVTQDQPRTDSIIIRNKSNLPLNNIQLSVLSAPDGCSFTSSPLSLGGLEENYLVYTVTGSTLTQGNYYEEVRLKATSSEGAETTISIWYYCMEPRGVLDVMPKSLATTMTKGKSKIVDVMLTNNGTAATGNISIDLPDVEWMSVVGNDTLPSLAVNDTAYFSLRFSPGNEIPLVQYSGTIAINSERGDAIGLPYTITAVADSTGTLVIDVTDDYTWNTNNGNGPHLEGAEVTLKGYYSLETVAYGITDANGVFQANDLPEGYYRLSVTAERHSDYNGVVFVEAGATDRSYTNVYLQYQAVTYSWTVEPTEIQDEYTYELNVMFETNVPVPVVVIEAPKKLPEFDETYMFDYVITNHGLINAENLELHVPISDDYLFTPLFSHIDTLHALSTVVVPCVVTHNNGDRDLRDCAEWGYTWTEYTYKCHKIDGTLEVKTMSGFVYTLLGNHPCEPPTELAGNGGGGGFAAPLFGIVGGHGFPNPFFTSPLLEMWYECDNGCVNMVFWGIDKLLSNIPLVKYIYNIAKVVYNTATIMDQNVKDALISVYDFYKYVANMANATSKDVPPVLKYMKIAKEVKTVKQNIIHCYHYLNGTATKDYELELDYLEVPDEIAEMLQYMDEYASAATNMVDILNMYYSDTTWFYSDINELDGFMNMVFEYDSVYGRVNVDPMLLSHKPSNISENQVISFVERYNNTLDIYNGIIINSDNYVPMDSIYSKLLSIINIENEAVLLGFESGADRITHLINEAYDYIEDTKSSSVCAKVSVQFSQKMTMTREAFEGTFIVHNGNDTDAMTEIGLNLVVKDEDGNDCTDLFQINTTFLENLTGIEGSGSLEAGLDGTAKLMFIPTINAAPAEPKIYYFGGTFTYVDPFYFDVVTIDLYPVEITVHPSCDLKVDYFMQRTIIGDDALTEDVVEPSVPAELGVIINNKGAGMAKNVILETAEPQIIDNEKGLAVSFGLYDASFNGSPRQLGLHDISFGNIESGLTAVGEWRFTSSLLGHFVSYQANLIHNSSYGNPDLSLVSHLDIHELIHPIYAYGNLDDGINDFLVNDNPDAYDTPDSIYFSHGGKTSVGVVDGISYDHLVSRLDTIVTLTVVPSRIGWNYGVTDDPGMNQYDIVSCIRNNDNQVIPLNNVWLTFVTIPDGGDPIYENKLHIVDTLAVQQTTTYTLVFAKKPSSLRIFNGNVDEYWSNAANWEGYILPQAEDEVLINGICLLDEDVDVYTLTIAENQNLTIPTDKLLNVSGTLTSEATSRIIIEDGGQLKHRNEGVQATVKKNIDPYTNNDNGWYLIASPLVGLTSVASVTNMLSNESDLYGYNEPTAYWINQKYAANGFTELVNGKGYLYANSEGVVLEFPGTLRSGNTTVTVPLFYTEGTDLKGFNLVGNPFVYNLTAYASTNVADGCFRMNETRDDLIVSEVSETNPLKPAEGFFVKALGEGATLTFNPQMNSMAPEGSIHVELSENNLLIDRLIVKTNEARSLKKFSLNETRTKLFAQDNRHEWALGPCASNEQPVSFKAAKNGTYTINVNADGMEFYYLHLIDNLTGADVDLLALRQAQGPMGYTFEARTTDYASRFLLRFIPKDSPSTGSGTDHFAYCFNDKWIITNEGDATLQVIDILGHVLSSERINGTCEKQISTSAGVYMLRLISGDEMKVQKIVVK